MGKNLSNSELGNMSSVGASITLNGSVPIVVDDKEIVSLTGSATIVKIGGKRYLIDLGMFQGGEGADFFNSQNTDFLNDIDGVIVTHSHIDHIGRLPILYKMGYRGPIYMTYTSARITYDMLLDSCKIQAGEVEERMRRNNKLGSRLKKALQIQKYLLNGGSFHDVDEKNKQKAFLTSILGEDFDRGDVLNSIEKYLDFYEVKVQSDIEGVLLKMRTQDYDENDIAGVMGLVKTLEKGEERILNSSQRRASHDNHELQEILDNLPLQVLQGYTEKIVVSSRSEKRRLRQKWEKQLSANIRESIKKGTSYDQQKQELQHNLEAAYTFCQQYKYLEDEKNPQNQQQHKAILGEYKKHKQLLDKYYIREYYQIENRVNSIQGKLDLYEEFLETGDVDKRQEITQVVSEIELFVDEFDIRLPFRSIDIKSAYDQIEIDNTIGRDREIIGITFSDAAHIIGAVSVTFTSGVVKNKVKKLMDLNGDATTLYLSGDLGRIDHNRLGAPEIPPFPVDYLQIESTYGGKEHRDRDESVQDLVESIQNSKGNVLISVFSQQRAQEILQTLLEYKSQNSIDALDYEIVLDAPLAEDVTEIYMRYEGEIYNLLDIRAQEEIFGGPVFRFLEEGEWEDLYSREDTNSYHKKFLGQLMNWAEQDKPKKLVGLIDKMQQYMFGEELFVYNGNGEWSPKPGITYTHKYLFLTEHITIEDSQDSIFSDRLMNLLQVELFDKRIFLPVENEKYRIVDHTKKHIILASSGMIDGGAIMNHLPGILTDKDATLLAPGYLSMGTIGNDIVIQKEPSITVGGKQIPIHCNTKFIDGFSSHIGHSDILQFITESIKTGKLKRDATIALNHGSRRGQELLKKDIQEILIGLYRTDINITIPEIFETYDVFDRSFTRDLGSDLITNYAPKDACVVPSFLLSNAPEEDSKSHNESDIITFDIGQINYEKQSTNSKSLEKISHQVKAILSSISSLSKKYCEDKFANLNDKGNQLMGEFESIYSKLQSISGSQKRYLHSTIANIGIEQRQKQSELSRYRSEIKSLDDFMGDKNLMEEIYDEMFNFFKNIKPQILSEIQKLKRKIDQLEEQKSVLESDYRLKQDDKNVDTFKGSVEYSKYHKVLKKLNDQIQISKVQIKGKTKSVDSRVKTIRRSCYGIDSLVMKKHILQDVVYYEQDDFDNIQGLENILDLCHQTKSDIKTKIKEIDDGLDSYQDIEFSRRTLNFEGIDIYTEIFGDENNPKIDILQKYLDLGMFNEDDQGYISDHIDQIQQAGVQGAKAIRKIKKLIKLRQAENGDRGIDYTLDTTQYSNVCLQVLKHLFEKDYFESYIKPHFNVYLLLKTGGSAKTNNHIKQYILNKYNLNELKGFTQYFATYQPFITQMEYFEDLIDKITLSNNASIGDMNNLNDISTGIDFTGREISEINTQLNLVTKKS